MNKVIIIGRLTKEPEIKLTANNTAYSNFTVAVDRKFKDENGERQTDFINCVAWRKTAEFINKYFQKGSKIGITGSIQTRNFEKDGQKVFITEVLVEEAEFVESRSQSESQHQDPQPKQQEYPEGYGNLPFQI